MNQGKLCGLVAMATTFCIGLSDLQLRAEENIDTMIQALRGSLQQVRNNIDDYSGTVVIRERKNGKLGEENAMEFKIRNRKLNSNRRVVMPLSIYLRVSHPKSAAGREVIWVENRNSGKLIAHETGFTNLIRLHLHPKSFKSFMGHRHSLTELGIENLLVQLINRASTEGKARRCNVVMNPRKTINNRSCTMYQVTHLDRKSKDDIYQLFIFLDNEHRLPVMFATYLWPVTKGEKPQLDEMLIYKNLKFNVKLTDRDFDPDNPNYSFP